MRIKTLTVTGLKCGDFSHRLEPVNIFTGDPFTGKTARLEAIRLGLLGYIPELGKLPGATMALARNGSMQVRLDMDTGAAVSRRWWTERGATKTSADTATMPQVPAVLMDSNEYFGLGAKDQVRYVFGLAGLGDDAKNVGDVIRANLANIRVEGHEAAHEKAIAALRIEVGESDVGRAVRGTPVQEWIGGLIGDWRERLKIAKQNAARMSSTVQGLTALKCADTEETIANVDAELSALRKLQTERAGDVRSIKETIGRIESQQQERANLLRVLARTPDASARIAELEREQAELTLATGVHTSVAVAAGQEQSAARSESERVNRELARLVSEQSKLETKFNADMRADKCPHCGSKGKGWKANIEADFATAVAANKTAQGELKALVPALETRIAAAATAFKTATDADRAHDTAQRRLGELTRQLNVLRAGQTEAATLKAKIEAMPPDDGGAEILALKDRFARAGTDVIEMSKRIGELSERQAAYQRAKQDDARNAQARIQFLAMGAEKDVLTAAVAMLEVLQGEMVKQAFGAILTRANRFTVGILKSPIEYRDGELGRFDGSTWITHRTFSGTEQAVTYAALAAALAHESPIKIVMIDELGIMGREAKRAVVGRMVELVEAGAIDQFCGADCSGSDYTGMAVNLIPV